MIFLVRYLNHLFIIYVNLKYMEIDHKHIAHVGPGESPPCPGQDVCPTLCCPDHHSTGQNHNDVEPSRPCLPPPHSVGKPQQQHSQRRDHALRSGSGVNARNTKKPACILYQPFPMTLKMNMISPSLGGRAWIREVK